MANFTPPFATEADSRYPTSDERRQGFDCGPADRRLFHGLFNRIESELGHVIEMAGITQTDGRMTQVYEAIQALISAAIGTPEDPEEPIDTSQFLLLQQAASRLPIFPEVNTFDGRIAIISPSTGTVRVPAGVNFLHRGIVVVTTVLTDFPVVASKTYHLRWTNSVGFVLHDLADTSYNPTLVAETNPIFDSSYDSMLVARVVTNAANTATITNLANKTILTASGEEIAAMGSLRPNQHQDGVRPSQISQYTAVAVNFARTPQSYMSAANDINMSEGSSGTSYERNLGVRTLSRYQLAVWAQGDSDMWLGWAARA